MVDAAVDVGELVIILGMRMLEEMLTSENLGQTGGRVFKPFAKKLAEAHEMKMR